MSTVDRVVFRGYSPSRNAYVGLSTNRDAAEHFVKDLNRESDTRGDYFVKECHYVDQ